MTSAPGGSWRCEASPKSSAPRAIKTHSVYNRISVLRVRIIAGSEVSTRGFWSMVSLAARMTRVRRVSNCRVWRPGEPGTSTSAPTSEARGEGERPPHTLSEATPCSSRRLSRSQPMVSAAMLTTGSATVPMFASGHVRCTALSGETGFPWKSTTFPHEMLQGTLTTESRMTSSLTAVPMNFADNVGGAIDTEQSGTRKSQNSRKLGNLLMSRHSADD
jgi:hypothetical protein